jgi:acetyl esterase/lipase
MNTRIIILLAVLCLAETLHAQQEYKDIPYKDSLKLDLYLPADPTPRPLIVIIHGGAWVRGDKSLDASYYMRQLRDKLLLNGYAVASIDYTLLGKTAHFPAPIQDCNDATRWLKDHAARYHLDTTHIGLWGASAGGHLALLCGYDAGAHFDYVIDNFGPTDLNKLFKTHASFLTVFIFKLFLRKIYDIRNQLIIAFTQLDIRDRHNKAEITRLLASWSVLDLPDPHFVPTLILHGTSDKVVPLSQSKRLHNRLEDLSTLVKIPKGDHGFNNIDHPRIDTIVAQTIDYIKAHTKYQH